jgi:hypothetical protein
VRTAVMTSWMNPSWISASGSSHADSDFGQGATQSDTAPKGWRANAGTSSPAATPLRRERRSCQTSSDANGIEGANRRHDASSTRSNVTFAATAPGDFGSMSLPQARLLGEFDVPVAVRLPEEVIEVVHVLVELVAVDRLGDGVDGALELGENPAILSGHALGGGDLRQTDQAAHLA